MIELSNVGFAYPTRPSPTIALSDVTLRIPDGQSVAVLGRNGSGKSTLARLLNGLLLPASGVVRVDGVATSEQETIWAVRRRIGMVLSNPDSQIVATTVEEDVAFGLENLGVPPREMRERIDSALLSVGLDGFQKREPHLLSGGQKQRLAIAGVLAMQPRHLVLDEATSMLDAVGRSEVLGVLRRLNSELGVTIVLITHFIEEASDVDRVIVLDSGEVRLDGAPGQVLPGAEALRDAGILPPYATTLADRLRGVGLNIPDDIFRLDELADALCRLS